MSEDASVFSRANWSGRAHETMLLYVGPEHFTENLQQEAVKRMVRERRAWGAAWSYAWDCGVEGPWFTYVCDNPDYDLCEITSKSTRAYIRRGLHKCDVRQADLAWLAVHGYDTLSKSATRYQNYSLASRQSFNRHMNALAQEGDYECFGVWVKDKLAAYAITRVFAHNVLLASTKFDPAYSSARPMYALYFVVARHYLVERGLREVVGGWRELMHETNIGEFRVKMGWRKVYCRLGLYLVPWFRCALAAARVLRPVWGVILPTRHLAMLEGVFRALEIEKATRL
ncbi:MAG: GNAT family N-acetyltransferase [Phycisphaerae bacterium]|nr:GNAT family N-acetyltransferase [Phycisphaerae bacterium]